MKKVPTLSALLALALLVTPCCAGKPTTRTTSTGLKVYDATGQFPGNLAHLEPMQSTGQEEAPGITVFVPSVGRFCEMVWNGSEPSDRTSPSFLYFDGPGCSGNAYSDRSNIGGYNTVGNEYYLYGFKDENQQFIFYTITPPTGLVG